MDVGALGTRLAEHRHAYERSPPLRALLLSLLLLAVITAISVPASAGDKYTTIDQFAGGLNQTSADFGSCQSSDNSTAVRLPFDANVTAASLTLYASTNNTDGSQWVSADVGEDGSVEGNVSFSGNYYAEMTLGGSGFNNYTAAKNQTSGNLTVPVKFTSCAPTGGWNMTFYNLSLTYLQVIPANTSSPAFSGSIPDLDLKVNTSAPYAVYLPSYFSEPDGDALNFSLLKANASDPGWSNVTGSFNGSHLGFASANNWTGNLTFQVKATDPANLSATSNNVTLRAFLNRAPVFGYGGNSTEIPNQSTTVDLTRVSYTYLRNYFYDPDFNDTSTFSVVTANASDPGWANVTVNVSLGYFVFSSSSGWLGNLTFRVRATDEAGAWAESNNITLNVRANEPPVFSGPSPDLLVGRNSTQWGNTTYFWEPDAEPLTIAFVKSDPNATGWPYVNVSGFNGSSNLTSGYFYVTASGNWSGVLSGFLRASDPAGRSTDGNAFNITVNGAPESNASIPDQTIVRGTTSYMLVNLSLHFSDPEGDALTLSAYRYWSGNNTSTPITVTVNGTFLDIASTSGLWTGSDTFYVVGCDAYTRCAWSNNFQVIVIVQPNRAPSFNGTVLDISVIVGRSNLSAVDLAPYFSDPDNDVLSYGFAKADPNATGWLYLTLSLNGSWVDVRSTSLVWTGDLAVGFYARDPSFVWVWTNTITVHVQERDLVPTFSGPIDNLTMASGANLTDAFDANDYFADPNGYPLAYSAVDRSASDGWNYTALAWNGSKLNISNDGSARWTGTLCFQVRATDVNGSTADSNDVCVVVVAPLNAPPAPSQPLPQLQVPAGASSVVVVDLARYFTDDAFSGMLTFEVREGAEPEWAEVEATVNGSLLTIAFLAPVPPVNLTFEVVVTDVWGASYVSPPVVLRVAPKPDNRAPQVSGPPSVTLQLGAPLEVQLLAFDEDGDALIWQIIPSARGLAATFNESSKRLTLLGSNIDERASFEVLVVVTDGWGASSEIRIAAVVWDPYRTPEITLLTAANRSGAVWVNGSVAFGTQPAGAPPPSAAISIDGSAALFASLSAGTFSLLWPYSLTTGEHTVLATVRDGFGRLGEARSSVFVPEPLPAVPVLLGILRKGLPPAEATFNESLTFVLLSASPVPGGVTVSWYLDGEKVGEGLSVAGLKPAPGTHLIEARASNGEVERSTNATFTVRAPSLPATDTGGAGNAALLYGALFLAIAGAGLFAGFTQTGRYFLLWALIGSVFARLKRESLLDHFVRGRLYQAIADTPGIHLAELRRRTNIAHGTAIHHLHVLEKGGYIRAVPSGPLTRFYTTEQPFEDDRYGLNDGDLAVLSVVTEAPGITQGELSVRLQRSASTVSRSVARLSTLGYVTTEHNGRGVSVYPRPGARLEPPEEPPGWAGEGDERV